MIEIPNIFNDEDFKTTSGEWVHPGVAVACAQDRFEEWFEGTFSRRVWIKKSEVVPGVAVLTHVYEPETMKELPNESSCSEFWEVRKR